jgi:hypothetical protein
MRTAKQYAEISRINFRPEVFSYPICQLRLRRTCTVAQRTIVACTRVLRLTHYGYRCPDEQCAGRSIMYRSAQADALALPSFTDCALMCCCWLARYGWEIADKVRERGGHLLARWVDSVLHRLPPRGARAGAAPPQPFRQALSAGPPSK